MPKSKSLGMQLRALILQHAIRQEALTAEILKFIFKILKAKTKTFGNSGSSISFQNKIDFLHDLDDISENDYPHFKKLLEIRNQFAHNYRCSSFTALEKENSAYVKYLHKHFWDKKLQETNLEKKGLSCYIAMFKYCHKILHGIRKKYIIKYNVELERFQSHELLNNKFSEWITEARRDFEESWIKYQLSNLEIEPDKISLFILSLEMYKYRFFADIIENEKNNGQLIKKVFNK